MWAIRIFEPRLPAEIREKSVDDLILALVETTSPESLLYVDVTENRGGERVQVHVG